MKKTINLLIQLQELIEARMQQEAMMMDDRLDTLNHSIDGMVRELPPDVAGHFQRLQKRSYLAIVPLINGICTGCGMKVPISQAHAVNAALHLNQCSHCSRYLFRPEGAVARRTPGRPISGISGAGIARFSHPDLSITPLKSGTLEGVLQEMGQAIEKAGFVDNGLALAEAALRRESVLSTALDHGLAFPHARGIEGGGLTLSVGIHPKGVRFSPDVKSLTHIIFFVSIPTAASAFYLKLLAGLTKTFQNSSHREKLLSAKNPEELWKALKTATRRTIA